MRISGIDLRNPYRPCTTGRLHLASWDRVTTKISLVLVHFGLMKLKTNQNTSVFHWIQSAYNLSDMLSKHWDHPSVYPMILKLLITRGNITLIPREATQEKEKEILNPQKEKFKNEEKQNKNMK